jgi:hypothetical protein
MQHDNWDRLGLILLVGVAFFIGDKFRFDPAFSLAVSSTGSSLAWALSTTFHDEETCGVTNLAAALLAATATGFYWQLASPA